MAQLFEWKKISAHSQHQIARETCQNQVLCSIVFVASRWSFDWLDAMFGDDADEDEDEDAMLVDCQTRSGFAEGGVSVDRVE